MLPWKYITDLIKTNTGSCQHRFGKSTCILIWLHFFPSHESDFPTSSPEILSFLKEETLIMTHSESCSQTRALHLQVYKVFKKETLLDLLWLVRGNKELSATGCGVTDALFPWKTGFSNVVIIYLAARDMTPPPSSLCCQRQSFTP